jgi:hypothetical protein
MTTRPLRRFSDAQLEQLGQALRDERRLRREVSDLYRSELNQRRRQDARYSRGFQIDVMRRNMRSTQS